MIADVTNAVEPSQWVAPLSGAGLVAVLIKWMIGRFDSLLRDVIRGQHAIDASNNRQTRALLALTLALDKSQVVRREVEVITAEMEKSEKEKPEEAR